MPKKQFIGFVISSKMQKTVVVEVESTKHHPKYLRTYKTHKNYKAHTDEVLEVGDKVVIEECPPISKDKKWRVIKKI